MSKFKGKDFLIQRSLTATAWVISTAYTVGVYVTTATGTYKCITAGTSAATGTGPGTTSSNITDGTAHWKFMTALIGKITIAGMRSTSMKINNEQCDVTDKGTVPWRQLLDAGVRSMELSGSGVYSDDASMDIFMADVLAGSIVTMLLISGRGDSFSGSYLVSGGERSGEYNGAEQYTMSFASADTITYTAAP